MPWCGSVRTPRSGSRKSPIPNLAVRPNPVVDRLFVRGLDHLTVNGTVLVQDAMGRDVLSAQVGDIRNGLDVGALRPGTYSLRIGAFSQRFVKQ
ncbi:MAG: T9SS type A sorting domain-containing protein [Flavobacteriales bacterium]|nr:T9SS type A sorting domain-containing protein [Flavobacteriales bacterium]